MGAGVYVGWNIGANDSANCVGPTEGCGLLKFRKAVVLVAIFVILGGILQGHHVMESIVNVSDLAEDAADRLELVTLKSMV